ncbi:hypothetical protein SAMN05216588_101243 [Pseudomonas flavescens]|uniref:Uncharacterized protein n=1 Tax=Phytopseudomonas flavescens TaxID=29435 RepID=A0A1G7XRI8_9GAMM|nr:hypothetical protein [Pseudomonas flavescens]SDG86807.1 hypothetical protein SAMN05216588_101243 [Pseudomonas flavescens]
MHHLTTLNLPTPSSKEADRQWLAAMMAKSGAVQVIESPIEQRPLSNRQWTASSMTVITPARREEQSQKAARKGGRPFGTTADDSALVERAKAMAFIGLSRYAASRQLKIGCDRLDRICRAHDFSFTNRPNAA